MTTDRLQPSDTTTELFKTEDEWRRELSPEEYRVTRQRGTERAFTGAYYATKEPGTYTCTCCGEVLFESQTKFDSGTGWPSFYAPAREGSVRTETDTTHGMVRSEVVCARCNAHLGHIFPDGPPPTGQRYCINSISLKHQPPEE